jgi:hypothetical protein
MSTDRDYWPKRAGRDEETLDAVAIELRFVLSCFRQGHRDVAETAVQKALARVEARRSAVADEDTQVNDDIAGTMERIGASLAGLSHV